MIMSEQNPVQLVKDAYAAFSRNDIASIINLMADDVSWYLPGPPKVVPFVGRRKGKTEVNRFFSTLVDVQDVERFEPQEFIAQGDKVVALGNYQWRVKATGRTYESEFAHVFTVRGGKIVEFHEYFDTAAAINAFGTSTQTATA
jgi:ketosteroid isomerase-like protein